MAKPAAVWGIDIGQSALKAIRCVAGPDKTVVAEAFDFVEYGKILSQPDANPVELVRDALAQFLSRNKLRGDKVVISVPGQSGLARFIKLPPVEKSKVPDIVRYEAKQQIPFPLEEVVWDYQQISGGAAEDFALDSEVGLFAMKRDQVYKALEPFTQADVEVDVIQLTPLALFNFMLFDQMPNLPNEDQYDPDNPPPSMVVVSMGTESTDLVITNGFRVWQRSIPLGGNHFTKALVKDLKLNFAMAEHLKRNSASAEDPKALFQAMRPVFGDLLTELQRSIGYFKNNIDRAATIGKVVVLGNVMKLPGLQKYLAQNLGYDVVKVERFRALTGPAVVEAAAFKDNVLAYGVSYGLALQGLGLAKLQTSLVPKEIIQDRMIRAKKPWAAAAAALILLGMGANYFFWHRTRETASMDPKSPNTWTRDTNEADTVVTKQKKVRDGFEMAKANFIKTDEVGKSMIQNVASRDQWMRMLHAVNLCLPLETQLKERDPKSIAQRNEIKIDQIYCRWTDRLEDWKDRTEKYRAPTGDAAKTPGTPPAAGTTPEGENPPPTGDAPTGMAAAPTGPTVRGPGWVVLLIGHHYHNDPNEPPTNRGGQYVINTLLANLKKEQLSVPADRLETGAPSKIELQKQVGIMFPVVTFAPLVQTDFMRPAGPGEGIDPNARQETQGAPVSQPRQNFDIQFAWIPGGLDAMPAAPEATPAMAMNQ